MRRLPRALVFLDGENLLIRFEAMKSSFPQLQTEVTHRPGLFVWAPALLRALPFEVLRATYYTTVVGDDAKVAAIRADLQEQKINSPLGVCTLHAAVFKKSEKSYKTRSVDINITIDALRHCHAGDADAFCFVTGDADFLPLIETIMRAGKVVHVLALSSGLAQELRQAPDVFWNADPFFFLT